MIDGNSPSSLGSSPDCEEVSCRSEHDFRMIDGNLPSINRVDTVGVLHGEPGGENVMVELTILVLFAVVGHEAVHESVCSRLDKHTSKRTVKKVSTRRGVSILLCHGKLDDRQLTG